jgi:hypothetical protein
MRQQTSTKSDLDILQARVHTAESALKEKDVQIKKLREERTKFAAMLLEEKTQLKELKAELSVNQVMTRKVGDAVDVLDKKLQQSIFINEPGLTPL